MAGDSCSEVGETICLRVRCCTHKSALLGLLRMSFPPQVPGRQQPAALLALPQQPVRWAIIDWMSTDIGALAMQNIGRRRRG
jgi:hypothetical protein